VGRARVAVPPAPRVVCGEWHPAIADLRRPRDVVGGDAGRGGNDDSARAGRAAAGSRSDSAARDAACRRRRGERQIACASS
jgi:hypothetical protein